MDILSDESDESLLTISHENNRIFLKVSRDEVLYQNDPRVTVTEPTLEVYVRVTHHIVPENLNHHIPQPLSRGLKTIFNESWLNRPLAHLSGDEAYAKSAFENLLLDSGVPLDLGDPDLYGQLHWTNSVKDTEIDRPGDVPLDGVSGAAARVLEEFNRIAAGVYSRLRTDQELAVIRLDFRIVKRTVVDLELYSSFDRVRLKAAVVSLEKMNLGSGDESSSECSICLRDVESGTHVRRLPCSHWFHKDCIVTWFRNSQTCPLCRFELVKNYFGT